MKKVYALIMNDQGTELVIGYFLSEDAANATIGNINLLPKEPQEFYGESVEIRAFKLNGTRYIDQGAEYSVREIDVANAQLEPDGMTIAEFMKEEEAEHHRPYIDKDVKTDDLC